MKLERYSESDPTRLRLYVKESNFKERPALTVVHTDTGIEFEKDKGRRAAARIGVIDVRRWLAEYLWAKGVNVEVDYGSLIGAAGDAGYAGELSEDGRRWSNPKLLDRAIKAINDGVDRSLISGSSRCCGVSNRCSAGRGLLSCTGSQRRGWEMFHRIKEKNETLQHHTYQVPTMFHLKVSETYLSSQWQRGHDAPALG